MDIKYLPPIYNLLEIPNFLILQERVALVSGKDFNDSLAVSNALEHLIMT